MIYFWRLLRPSAAFIIPAFSLCLLNVMPGISAPVARAHSVIQRRTPLDSFLRYKVYSVDQLIQQVQADSGVRTRFARHFHIPQSRVISYMSANLVESYIPVDGRYTVYCIHPTGTIYPVTQRFLRGTKVFALRNGQPVMKWVCGNPLSRFLPVVETKTVVKRVPVIKTVAVVKVSPSIEMITPTDTEDIFVPVEPGMTASPLLEASNTNLVVPTTQDVSSPTFFSTGGLGDLALLPLLPIGLLAGGFSSNPSHSAHPPVPAPEAVPEPGMLSYLAVIFGFAFYFQWKRGRVSNEKIRGNSLKE